MVSQFRIIFLTCIVLLCSGCGSQSYAPVMADNPDIPSQPGHYVVRPGDTLFSIAFAFGLDYRTLARVNHLKANYAIQSGQTLIVATPSHEIETSTLTIITQPKKAKPGHQLINTNKHIHPEIIPLAPSAHAVPPLKGGWIWPAQGKVINRFSPGSENKGINISNTAGTPIVATASGQVVYAGSGLSGYGQLLIIKHNDVYLSAYAHNASLLVKEGDMVKQGQEIATMGDTGSNQVMLHFEIRKAGQPVDPLNLLPTH